MFDTDKQDLKDILHWAAKGELQLPDFQRDYVWNDADVRSLIASVAKGFPVGALLTLETGGEVSFKPRVLEGVSLSDLSHPSQLLLDGQQRVTSLFQSTYSKEPVKTRNVQGREVDRYYYIDIRKALDSGADIEDSIIGMPRDKVLRTNFGRDVILDLSNPELEFEHHHFPLNQVFDCKDWFYSWRDHWKERNKQVYDMERDFDKGFVDHVVRYKLPIIRLNRSNSREAICLVFEKVNVGGKKLDAFELVTAIYAAEEFDLRADWKGAPDQGRYSRMLRSPNKRDVLREVCSTDFLQACTLLHTRAVRVEKAKEGATGKELPQISCRRDALLALPLEAYRKYADSVESGFIEAAQFLNELKIIWHKDIPYPPQVIGLAATFAIMGKQATTIESKKKLAMWFWSITCGELYGSGTETRLARDVPELIAWIGGVGNKPRSLDEAIFQLDRLNSLRTRISAAYKGIHALLMNQGCRDFSSGKPTDIMTFFNDQIDIHHVFPQKWCKDNGIPPSIFNSIVNKTPLSKLTNISIGGEAPSIYLAKIENKEGVSPEALDDILRTHLIEPSYLRNDDFDGYFADRMNKLGDLVGNAMGKSIIKDHRRNEEERDVLNEDEFPE
jgi:hypothetical protein